MTITAKVIADSIGVKSPRLTTFQLKYPRFIHSEIMTHRVFARNASSSRAIPVERQIAAILEDTAMPMHWGKNQKGMQADEEIRTPVKYTRTRSVPVRPMHGEGIDWTDIAHQNVVAYVSGTPEQAWLEARDRAIDIARGFIKAGYHKQIVNRLLEPYSHINVVVTATNYDNLFWLRRHKDAQPEFKILADCMWEELQESTPQLLNPGEWHLPYVTEQDRNHVWFTQGQDNNVFEDYIGLEDLKQISASRCARTSYMTHDGKTPDLNADLDLYVRLVGGEPLHASPVEHQATPDEFDIEEDGRAHWKNPELSGCFNDGWVQFRKTMPNEFKATGTYEG